MRAEVISGGRKPDEYRCCVNAVKVVVFVVAVQAVLSNVECFGYTVFSRSQNAARLLIKDNL